MKIKILLSVFLAVFYLNNGYAQCNVIYVTADGSGNGQMNDPSSLAYALLVADSGDIIRLANDTFLIDNAIELKTGWTIEGGFIPDFEWTKTSEAGATHIIRTANNPTGGTGFEHIVAITGDSVTHFRLQDLTVSTVNADGNFMTTYGVHLSGCSDYSIARTMVMSGNGYNGINGVKGVNGAIGSNGSAGSAGDADDNNASGAGGRGGNGAGTGYGFGASGASNSGSCCQSGGTGSTGGFSSNYRAGGGGGGGGGGGESDRNGGRGGYGGGVSGAYSNNTSAGSGGGASGCNGATNGNSGNSGLSGINGAAGANSPGGSHATGYYKIGPNGGNGKDGSGGQGGAGGGGGGGQGGLVCIDGSGSGGGGGGGGGQGGTGGTGGTSGGGSFAVYLHNNGANSSIIQSYFQSGQGGTGGTGGTGGFGGSGGQAGAGSGYTGGGDVGYGGYGGWGGRGGTGGKGGSGSNGEAYDLVQIGGIAPDTAVIDAPLQSQPIILTKGHCANEDVQFSSNTTGTWNWGSSADPSTGSGLVVTTQYSDTGRFDVSLGANTYEGFVYISPFSSSKSNAGDGQTICYGETATMGADAPAFGTGTWSTQATGDFNPSDPNTNVDKLEPGDHYFYWTISSACCPDQKDSVLITVLPLNEKTITPTACFSYTTPSGGMTIEDNGEYTLYDTVPGTGCDTAILIQLTLNTTNQTVIKLNEHTLRSEDTVSTYQWLDCVNALEPISGETSRMFVATTNGSYAVELTNNGCVDTSECVLMNKVGINPVNLTNVLKLYPSPANNSLFIEIRNHELNIDYSMVSILGVEVQQGTLKDRVTEVDLSTLHDGIYFLQTPMGSLRFHVIR